MEKQLNGLYLRDLAVHIEWLIPVCRKFLEQAKRQDLVARYRRLVRGLDPQSLKCVTRLLSRIETFAKMSETSGAGGRVADLYTPDEAAAIRKLHQEFYRRIVTLAPDVYAWEDYLLPVKHFEAPVLYYHHQLPLLDKPQCLQGRAALDVGANTGDSALVLRRYTQGPIYSFEPVSSNFRQLERTLELNECRNVFAVNKALGSTAEQRAICVASGSSTLDPQHSPEWQWVGQRQQEMVEVTALDDFVRGLSLDIGLIKVDVEGFEQQFLAGAQQTICAHRPVLLLSIYHNADDFFDIKPLIESWKLDYSFKISRPPLDPGFTETLLICEPR